MKLDERHYRFIGGPLGGQNIATDYRWYQALQDNPDPEAVELMWEPDVDIETLDEMLTVTEVVYERTRIAMYGYEDFIYVLEGITRPLEHPDFFAPVSLDCDLAKWYRMRWLQKADAESVHLVSRPLSRIEGLELDELISYFQKKGVIVNLPWRVA